MVKTHGYHMIAILSLGLIASPPTHAQTWTSLTSGSTASLGSVYFPTAQVGYATGLNNIPANILKTTNGGTSWAPTFNMDWTYNDLYFISADTGWIVGNAGDIRKTTNGGTAWINQTPSGGGTQLNAVFFLNSNFGWAAVNGTAGNLTRTTNGGTNWTTLATGSSFNPYDVAFFDTSIGIITGSTGIRKTTNGGTTWSSVGTGSVRAVHFPNRDTGYAVGDLGRILRTVNGGDNWIEQHGGIFAPTAISGNTFHAVSCVSGMVCFAASSTNSGDWRIFRTTSAGTSWAAVDSGAGAGASSGKVSIHFPSAAAGFFVARGGQIRKSTAAPASIQSSKSTAPLDLRLSNLGSDWVLSVNLPQAEIMTLTLNDLQGRTVWSSIFDGKSGLNTLLVPHMTSVSGLLVLNVEAGAIQHSMRLLVD